MKDLKSNVILCMPFIYIYHWSWISSGDVLFSPEETVELFVPIKVHVVRINEKENDSKDETFSKAACVKTPVFVVPKTIASFELAWSCFQCKWKHITSKPSIRTGTFQCDMVPEMCHFGSTLVVHICKFENNFNQTVGTRFSFNFII